MSVPMAAMAAGAPETSGPRTAPAPLAPRNRNSPGEAGASGSSAGGDVGSGFGLVAAAPARGAGAGGVRGSGWSGRAGRRRGIWWWDGRARWRCGRCCRIGVAVAVRGARGPALRARGLGWRRARAGAAELDLALVAGSVVIAG